MTKGRMLYRHVFWNVLTFYCVFLLYFYSFGFMLGFHYNLVWFHKDSEDGRVTCSSPNSALYMENGTYVSGISFRTSNEPFKVLASSSGLAFFPSFFFPLLDQ